LLRPRRVRANSRSRGILTRALPHSRRVLLLPSIVRLIIKELQSFGKNRELYFKSCQYETTRTLNSAQQLDYKRKSFFFLLYWTFLRACTDFPRDQLKPNDSDRIGDEGAAAQQYICIAWYLQNKKKKGRKITATNEQKSRCYIKI